MFIAYIYDKDNNLIAQVEDIIDLDISNKINDISTASFSLHNTNEYATRTYLKEYRRVKIHHLADSSEKVMFDGVIRGFDADLNKTSVKLASFEHLLDRRLIHSDKSFSSVSVDSIVSDVLSEINTRYETNITLDCGITDITSKEYKKAETGLSILQDLAGNGYEFIIEDLVLKFKETVGIDRTTWENFVEYRYDIDEPDYRSIDSVKMTVDGKEFANGIIWKAWSNYTELDDPTSISEFGLIESSFINSGDDASATSSFLWDHKDSVSEFEVWTITNDFFEANIGDEVKVYIFVGNDIMFYDWSMKVIEKKYTSGDLPSIGYVLGKTKVQSKNIIEQILDTQSRIKSLELK